MPRASVKLLLLDEQDRVLLVHAADPRTGLGSWYPVGGGVEAGESLDEAARREAYEETGLAGLPDGLHAFVCGSGSPLPDRTRAGPCLTVIAGQRVFLVDAGEGAAESLSAGGIPAGRIDRLFKGQAGRLRKDGVKRSGLVRIDLDVGEPPNAPDFRWGVAPVQGAIDRLREAGVPNSGIVDRHYFHSLYFREPGGVLFELATEEPGFTVDGPVEELGRRIILPPWLEGQREAVEARLTPLPDPRADWPVAAPAATASSR